jgi:HAD superfamily hydrolase (TIGR01450 family)
MKIAATTVEALLEKYSVFLLDMFGVLVSFEGPLPGACEFIRTLNETQRDYLILSNGCRYLADGYAKQYQSWGLPIPEERILASSMLIQDWVQLQGLEGAAAWVIGAESCQQVVRRSGLDVIPSPEVGFEVMVLSDQSGLTTLTQLEQVFNALCLAIDKGTRPRLLLPNPDLIYPMRAHAFGFTAGALALLLEGALVVRYPGINWDFEALGKPHPGIFLKAQEKIPAPTREYVMLGDQLVTDIQGAHSVRIDSVLLATGVMDLTQTHVWPCLPTYWLPSLV